MEGNKLSFMHLLVTTDTSITKHTPLSQPSGEGKDLEGEREGGREGNKGRTQRHVQDTDSRSERKKKWRRKGNNRSARSCAGVKILVCFRLCLIGRGASPLGRTEGKSEKCVCFFGALCNSMFSVRLTNIVSTLH